MQWQRYNNNQKTSILERGSQRRSIQYIFLMTGIFKLGPDTEKIQIPSK